MINPPSLLEDVTMALLAVSLGWAAGVLLRGGIFLNVLVGGGGGAVGPKELMGWVGSVPHVRSYPPPTPRFTEVRAIVSYNMSNYCYDDIAKS